MPTALRERREDLPALCAALLQRISQESGLPIPALTPAALDAIASHPLKGNVRELENLLHRAVALSDGKTLHIEATAPTNAAANAPAQLEPPLTTTTATEGEVCPLIDANLPHDLQAWLDQQERDILVRALHATGFNRTVTAARLGISLRQIRYRIARLNIAAPHDSEPHADAEH